MILQSLVTYLFAAMVSWTAAPDCALQPDACATWQAVHHESADDARDRMRETAEQIGWEVWRRSDPSGLRNAVRLAAIAFEESGLAEYVDSGSCNDPKWRVRYASELLRGGCDGGWAYSVWQIHTGWAVDRATGRATAGRELVENRSLAIRVAYEILQTRPSAWTTWPRAAARAEKWISAHPFRP